MVDEKFDDEITKEDIDFGSLDDELDQDLEKFDLPLDEPKPKERKPVTDFTLATARGILLPSEETLKTVEDEITKRMPETGKILSDVSTVATSIDMYKTQFMSEITPALNRLRSVGRRLFEKVENYVPTKLKTKIQSFLKTPEEARQESLEDSRNAFIQQQIMDLAKIQAESLEKRQISEEVINFINQQIEDYRHKDKTTLLAHITQATKGAYAFLQTTLRTYIVKSLSLKYKSVFYLQDLVSLVRNILTILDTKLEEIKHNTALPDIVKSTRSEELKYYLHQKLYGRVSEKLSDFTKNFTQKLIENIKTNVFDKLKEKILEVAESAGTIGELSAGMAEEAEEYGMSKAGLAGEFAGGFIQGKLLSKLFKYLEKRHIDIAKVQNLDELISKLYTSTILGAGTWLKESDNKILQWLGENIIPSIQRERGEIENVLETNLTEPVPFDVMTRRAIVEIIPGYLSLIHSEAAGIREILGAKPAEKLVYDVKTETFTTEKTIKERIKHELLGTEQSRLEKFKPLVKHIAEQYLTKGGDANYFYQHIDDITKFAVNVVKHAEPIRFSIIKKLKEGEDLSESELTSSTYMFKDVKNPDALVDILYTAFARKPESAEEIIKTYEEFEELPETATFTEKLKHKLSQIKQNLKEKYESAKESVGELGSIAEFNKIAQTAAIELDDQLIDTLNKIKQVGQQSLLTEFLQTKTPEQIEAYRQKLIKEYQEENIKKLKKKYKSEEEIPDYLFAKAKELTLQQKSEIQSKVAEFASKTGLSHDIIREKLREFDKEELIKDIKELHDIHQKLQEKQKETQKEIPMYSASTLQREQIDIVPQPTNVFTKIKTILEETLYPIKAGIFAMKDLLTSLVSKASEEEQKIESGKGGTGLVKDEPQISGPGFYIQKAEKELHIPLETKEDKEAFLTALSTALANIKSDKINKDKLTSFIKSIRNSLTEKASDITQKHQTLKQLEEAIKQGDYTKARELIKSYAILTKESTKEQLQNQIDKSPTLTKTVNIIKSLISTPAKWIKNIWKLEYNLLKSAFTKPFKWTKSIFSRIKNWMTAPEQQTSKLPFSTIKPVDELKQQHPSASQVQQLTEISTKATVEQTDISTQMLIHLQAINESLSTIGSEISDRLDQILITLQSSLSKEAKGRLFKLPKIQPKGLIQKLKSIMIAPFTYTKQRLSSGLQLIKKTGANFLTQAQKYLIDLPKSIVSKPFNILQSGIRELGSLSSKAYEKIKDIITRTISKVTQHKETIFGTVKSTIRQLASIPFNTASKIASLGKSAFSTLVEKYEQLKYPDIYVKDQIVLGYPKVPGEWIKIGRARLANGKPITDVTKINQPVIDTATAQVLITEEDLEKGLVDVHNKPLVSLPKRIKRNIEPLADLAKGTFSLSSKIATATFKYGTKLLSTGAAAVSTIFNKIAEKLHLPKLPAFTTGVSKKLDTIISLLEPVSKYFKAKLPELREGSYQDYLKDEQKEEQIEETKKELSYLKQISQKLGSPVTAATKTSIISKVINRFKKQRSEEEEKEGSFLGDLLKFELGKKALDYLKKTRIGKLGSKVTKLGSKILKSPFKLFKGIGKLGLGGLRLAGKLGLGAGRLALAGLGGLVETAGTVGSVLLSPWVAVPALIAGTGYVGYKLWKSHAEKNKVNQVINELFSKYYGTTNMDAIQELSKISYNKLLKNESFTRKEFQSIAKEFGFDPDDEKQMRYFATWYHNRFLPIFLKLASIMKFQFGKEWDEYTDLDPKTELPQFVQIFHKEASKILTPEILKLKPDIKSYLQFINKDEKPHAELLKPVKPIEKPTPKEANIIQKHIDNIKSTFANVTKKPFIERIKNTTSMAISKLRTVPKRIMSTLTTPLHYVTKFFSKPLSIDQLTKESKPSRSKDTIKHIVQEYYPYVQSAVSYVKNAIGIDIPPELVIGVIAQESAGKPDVVSSAGASGLMQILPITAQSLSKQIGIPSTKILTEPKSNILAGTYYLGMLYKQFNDWSKALAAYNWGPANVKKYSLTNAPLETKRYVPEVLGNTRLAKNIVKTVVPTTKHSLPSITSTIHKAITATIEPEIVHAAEPKHPVPVTKPTLAKPVDTIEPNKYSVKPVKGEIEHVTNASIDSEVISALKESNDISSKQLEVLININNNIQKLTEAISNISQLPEKQIDINKMLNEFNKNIVKLTEAISKMDASKYFTEPETPYQKAIPNTIVRQFSNRHIDLTKKQVVNQ